MNIAEIFISWPENHNRYSDEACEAFLESAQLRINPEMRYELEVTEDNKPMERISKEVSPRRFAASTG
jgi:hypothetical protein